MFEKNVENIVGGVMEGMVPGRQGTDWPTCGVMEGMVLGRWGTDWPTCWWTCRTLKKSWI